MKTSWVQVPGKVMLAGEYSVLSGGEALACSLKLTLTVTVTSAPGIGGCRVRSDLWREAHLVTSDTGPGAFPTEPLLAAVAHGMRVYQLSDADITLNSQLPITFGIGSSSALRLAVLVGMQDLARQRHDEPILSRGELWPAAREALALQQRAQKHASGYDLATQLHGGLVRFRGESKLAAWPGQLTAASEAESRGLTKLVHVYAGGSGAPTSKVLGSTLAWLQDAGRLAPLNSANAKLNSALSQALKSPDESLAELFAAVASQREVLSGAPSFPKTVAALMHAVPGVDERWSWKPTGAGGEDAVLLFGPASAVAAPAAKLHAHGWQPVAGGFASTGLGLERREEAAHGAR